MRRWAVTGIVLAAALTGCGLTAASGRSLPSRPPVPLVGSLAVASPAWSYSALTFPSASTGYIAAEAPGGRTAIFATDNGGRSFESLPGPAGTVLALAKAGSRLVAVTVSSYSSVGVVHIVIQSSSGGWTTVYRVANPPLLAFESVTAAVRVMFFGSVGYAVLGGLAVTSTNGGRSWSPMVLPRAYYPVSMSFTSARTGFLLGPSGCALTTCPAVVLATGDGGRRWQPVFTVPTRNGLDDLGLTFADPRDGFLYAQSIATETGRLYRTTDGGSRWSLADGNLASGRFVPEVPDFLSPQVGWMPIASGASPIAGGIETTTDGGSSWTIHNGGGTWSIGAVDLVSNDLGFALSQLPNGPNAVIATHDGGRSWTQVLPALTPTLSVAFSNPRDGWGLGLPLDPTAILATTDGGLHWSLVGHLPGPGRSLAATASPRMLWAVAVTAAGGNALYQSRDGGRAWMREASWQAAEDGVEAYAPALDWVSPGHVYVQTLSFPVVRLAALHGHRLRTLFDRTVSPGSSLVDWVGPTTGLLAESPGNRVVLYTTEDRGAHWRPIGQWPVAILQAMDFRTARVGWLVLETHPDARTPTVTLWKTQDGGASWQAIVLPSALIAGAPGSPALDVVSPSQGFLLVNGLLLATRDGGLRWAQVSGGNTP